MQKLLLPFLLAFVVSAHAQMNVYHEFPDSNAWWNVTAQGCCWTGCAGPPTPNPIIADYVFSYYINGDTLINSVPYRKMYKSGSGHEHCAYGNAVNVWYYYDDYFGAFREDTSTREVFYVAPSTTNEFVWYDFGAGVGDIMMPWEPCSVVASIDSVLIGNTYRKRFNLDPQQVMGYVVIEGIGSTSGLMEPVCPFEYSGTLTCFIQENQTLYPDTITSCDIITDMSEQHNRVQELTIAPNPFSSATNVYAHIPMRNSTLTIFNCLGEAVQMVSGVNGSIVPIERGTLPAGLYFFQLTEENVVIATGRAVIAD